MKRFSQFIKEEPRIPRKKGQPAGDKHSDLYTDENPKGTIHGLGFKDVETARAASVKKIESSGKSHAHKIQLQSQWNNVHGLWVRGRVQSIAHTLRR